MSVQQLTLVCVLSAEMEYLKEQKFVMMELLVEEMGAQYYVKLSQDMFALQETIVYVLFVVMVS